MTLMKNKYYLLFVFVAIFISFIYFCEISISADYNKPPLVYTCLDEDVCICGSVRDISLKDPYMVGADIKVLQSLLKNYGFYGGIIDGIYGPNTERAVIDLQKEIGGEATGIATAAVWHKLLKMDAFLAEGDNGKRDDYCENIDEISTKKQGDDVKRIIFINLPSRRLTLYDGSEEVFSAPISIGSLHTPSPIGYWEIINKSKWSGGFGTRWLGLNVPWGLYGIHGTDKPSSIGRAQSHGCIRMYNRDVEKLFELVDVGIKVKIYGGPFGLLGNDRPELVPGSKNSQVMAVQLNLEARGYYTGPIDGIYGRETEKAVHEFQRDQGLNITGQVDIPTYDALGLVIFE